MYMLNLVLESIGEEIIVNLGLDMTGLALAINFRPELGYPVSVTAQLGTVDRLSEGLVGNQYATYILTEGILVRTGRWQKQLTYGTRRTPWINFNVV